MSNDSTENPSEPIEAEATSAGEGVLAATPVELGLQRFVFVAYFALAILVAFVVDKVVRESWYRISQWKPAIGEPREEASIAIAAAVAVATTLWAWRQEDVRRLIEEVATELGQVTWPAKDDVGRSTVVVVGTTILATMFFALMDALWRFLTNLVYGA